MNEFTKEELQIIYETLGGHVWQNPTQATYLRPIIDKIQSMIDNYCDDDDIKESIYPHKECEICHQLVWGNYECPCGTRL
jgi:hypothetical protein